MLNILLRLNIIVYHNAVLNVIYDNFLIQVLVVCLLYLLGCYL